MRKIVLGALLLSSWVYSQSNNADLESAYQKEIAYLSAQKRELTRQLKAFSNSKQRNLDALGAANLVTQTNILKLSKEVDSLERSFKMSEDQLSASQDFASLKQSLFDQAKLSVGGDIVSKLDVPSGESFIALFAESVKKLENSAKLEVRKTDFFNELGEKVQSEVLHVGEVASVALGDAYSGPLAPAGGGNLKLWKAQVVSNRAKIYPIFLYDSLESNILKTPEKGLVYHWEKGGAVGWVIFFLCGFAVVLLVTRFYVVLRYSSNKEEVQLFQKALDTDLKREDLLKSLRLIASPTAQYAMKVTAFAARDSAELDAAVDEASLSELSRFDRFSTMLPVVAAIAPLLGLLGTVTGMISTFDIITEHGTGDPRLLSGGISEALLTTKMGLLTAIPVILMGQMLNAWSESTKDKVEAYVIRLLLHFRELPGSTNPPAQEIMSNKMSLMESHGLV
ncbi:MotA/TolQ/ExbB proton channel family protein [bacterium]|nr:MotA/TolQ/ExbB proton channel family protein [bacterium]